MTHNRRIGSIEQWTAASLFSGAGIGDLGLRAGGCNLLVMNEVELDRIGIARANFPEVLMLEGDVGKLQDRIVSAVIERLGVGQELDLMSCTAPCQGMSKNGQGTLLKNAREGKRPKLDPRNRLILPALKIMQVLRPSVCIFENVVEMERTYIEDENGNLQRILDIIPQMLGPEYVGAPYNVELADYGIPQRRQRLITVYSRNPRIRDAFLKGRSLIPLSTHSKDARGGKKPWVTVWDAIKDFPALDAASKDGAVHSSVPFHRVPTLDALKYLWVAKTPPGRSAFDNQCAVCGFDQNPTHSTARNNEGINRASRETPLFCVKCNAMLPRPSTVEGNSRRIMSGFTSAYKRMSADLPAPALTRNFSYACSDQKIHPFQNRVLSIAEAMTVHTLSDFCFLWQIEDSNGRRKPVSDALIRLVIGESIPPRFMSLLVERLQWLAEGGTISDSTQAVSEEPAQGSLVFGN